MATNSLGFASLDSFILKTATKHSDEIAFVCKYQPGSLFDIEALTHKNQLSAENPPSPKNGCLRWTYGDLLKRSQRLASNLYAEGLRKGTTVVAILDNGAEWVLLFWACVQLGSLFYPISPQTVNSKIFLGTTLRTIAKSGVIVVADLQMAEIIENELDEYIEQFKVICASSDNINPNSWATLEEIFSREIPKTLDFSTVASKFEDNDLVLMINSNGTASPPVTYGLTSTLVTSAAEAFQIARSLHKFDTKSNHFEYVAAVALQNLYFCHPFGLIWALGFWGCGGAIVVPSKSFDAFGTMTAINEETCTHVAAVPTMIQALVKQAGGEQREVRNGFGNVEIPFIVELCGTLVTQQPLVDICLEKLNATSVTVLNPDDDLGMDRFAINTTGKVGSMEKFNVTCMYMAAETKIEKSDEGLTSLEISLRQIWASALGMNPVNVPIDRDMMDFADSLTVLKVSGLISRELEMELSSTDIYFYQTIQAQAKSLDSSPTFIQQPLRDVASEGKMSSSPRSASTRVGPPHMFYGLPHIYYTHKELSEPKKRDTFNKEFKKTKDACNQLLSKYKLGWADVEDVLPMPPTTAYTYNYKPSARSWVCRTTLSSSRPCANVLSAVMYALAQRHPILRSVMVRIDDKPYHVVVRPIIKWLQELIFLENEVSTLAELEQFLLHDPIDPNIKSESDEGEGRPLFRASVCHVKSTDTTGLVIIASQGVIDTTSLSLFLEDVATYLTYGSVALKAHASYKLYACNYHLYENSNTAVENCYHFTQPLLGIHKLEKSLWPPTNQANEIDSLLPTPVSSPKPIHTNIATITHTIHIPSLHTLRQTRGIETPILLKAAISLFNISQTGATEALFSATNASRKWPFFEEYKTAERNQVWNRSVQIPGPTWELYVERIKVEEGEVVRDFLEGLQLASTQTETKFPSPLPVIRHILSRKDVIIYDKILTHQRYDWDPFFCHTSWTSPSSYIPLNVSATSTSPSSPSTFSITPTPDTTLTLTLNPSPTKPIPTPPTKTPTPTSQTPILNLHQTQNNIPINLLWRGALVTPQVMALQASFDAAQYTEEEVRSWVNEVLGAVEWLCVEGHWEECVHDCDFEVGGRVEEGGLV